MAEKVYQSKRRTQRDPFEVSLSEEREKALVDFLCNQIQYAIDARLSIVGDDGRIDSAHEMYEQGDSSLTKNTPWPGASNLGSFIVTERVDSMRARIVATLFADPIWIVEGWGDAADRAPLVEAFHQWKAERTRLQQYLARTTHNALIEGTGVLEVSDEVRLHKVIKRINALLQRDAATGAVVLGDDGQPVPVRKQDMSLVEAEPDEPQIQVVTAEIQRATQGPSFRVLSLKDFYFLPGHASERQDVWGYAKRVYRRLADLKQSEESGFYKNTDQLTEAGDRMQSPAQARAGQDIAPQVGAETVEKEIWEVTFLADLDDDGYESWYVATLHLLSRVMLRVQHQDYGTPHYIAFTPFPRPGSIYGYSYAYDKLGSLYDEHAAVRNMFADRSMLAASAPFLRVVGSLWNPAQKPFGPRQIIDVRDPNELKQLEVRDVPQSTLSWLQMVLSAAERLSGQNDVSTGLVSQQDRTLGEVRMATEQSFVRIDEVIKNYQEGMEELFDLLQIIWINKLEAEPEALPGEIIQALQIVGIDLPDKLVTADILRGPFRGKPQGSVETADFGKMRVDFASMMTALTQLAQAVPAVAQHLNNPLVIRSVMSQLARIYRWPDRQNLVASFTGQAAPPPIQEQPPLLSASSPLSGAPSNASSPALVGGANR